ncbi:FKBP-type peptidyl-prolyl cis-trans isomerase [Candidatus Promineifilum breve]|nr:FKBP-type peptidyl-prolyl cis-trans isomerase [Candidatus Promineifilum breve]
MKKRVAITMWAALLTILLLLAACGPAVSTEQADQMTAEAEAANPSEETTTEEEAAAGEETATEGEAAAGIPEVDGPITDTETGLRIVEIRAGDGRTPEPGDLVTMNIMGMLEDGTVFADTVAEGAPITATLTEADLFPGWLEGVLLMKEGGKVRLIIPPALAFGAEGAGGVIPPDATITMDVELLTAVAPPTPTAVDEGDLTTTDSGLQYFDIVEGEGDMPVAGQDVVVNYAAWLQEGEEYVASSDTQGEPLTFTLGSEMGVFPGWDEGVSTMRPGGKRYLVIPPDLALGEAGGGRIPPNSTLIMEVELVEVKPLLLPTEIDEGDFTETESGLRYYDIVVGDGTTAETGNTVTVNYTGWLTDNVKFDSSIDSGVPFPFTLGTGAVIPGWEEGVLGMKVGGIRQLVIPAALGYGDTGSGIIPPGATLVFEVELMDVQEAAE